MPAISEVSNTSSLRSLLPSTSSKHRDNASLIVPISVDTHAANRDDQLRQVARTICPFLTEDRENMAEVSVNDGGKASELKVAPLLGGLSNQLFILSKSGVPSVLVRIHPPETSTTAMLDREVENRLVAWLSQERMAPIFYGRFQNGRVEELYPNVAPLTATEMIPYGPKIAKALAEFHSLEAPASVLPKPPANGIPNRFETVDQWVQAIQNPSSPHAAFLQRLQSEWEWLRAQLLSEPSTRSPVQAKALQFIREVVVTHMDGQSLNILKDSTSSNGHGSIRLIDFEYAGWNPRVADLANTFCEHCDMNNICADYEAEYPSEAVQDAFLNAYLQQSEADLEAYSNEERKEILQTLRSEIGRFTLLSHLGWAAWSVVMLMEGSAIDFDYMAYAKHRMDGYEFGKKRFFSEREC